MSTQTLSSTPAPHDPRFDNLQFRLVFSLSLPVFFVAAAVSRLNPGFWKAGRAVQQRSIFSEAWEASGTMTQIAFAG